MEKDVFHRRRTQSQSGVEGNGVARHDHLNTQSCVLASMFRRLVFEQPTVSRLSCNHTVSKKVLQAALLSGDVGSWQSSKDPSTGLCYPLLGKLVLILGRPSGRYEKAGRRGKTTYRRPCGS